MQVVPICTCPGGYAPPDPLGRGRYFLLVQKVPKNTPGAKRPRAPAVFTGDFTQYGRRSESEAAELPASYR